MQSSNSVHYTTTSGQVYLHPTSCNAGRKGALHTPLWMVYLERVQTTRVYVRDSTLVRARRDQCHPVL